MEKLNNILAVIKSTANFHKRVGNLDSLKACVLMEDNISSIVASKLAVKSFGKENVTNVILPCYNEANYILDSAQFSNDNGIKYKNIGIKDVFDSITESGIVVEKQFVIDYLREKILEVEAYASGSIGFLTYKLPSETENYYTFFMVVGDKLECIGSFKEEELVEFSKNMEL